MFRFLRFAVMMILARLAAADPWSNGRWRAGRDARGRMPGDDAGGERRTSDDVLGRSVVGRSGQDRGIVAPDEVHHWGIGGDTTGFEEFSERWDLFFTAFPDLEFTVDLVVAEGDLVATHWTATGTQRGEWQGIAPTDREVTWQGINIFRFECGLIVESWGKADHLGLLSQLGAVELPAAMATPTA